MEYVEFDITNIGHFKARSSLTILEEAQLDNRIDDLMGGKFYENRARAKALVQNSPEIADEIFTLIFVMQIIATLEFVVIEKPVSIVSFKDITEYKTLFDIWIEYKKKVSPEPKEKTKS